VTTDVYEIVRAVLRSEVADAPRAKSALVVAIDAECMRRTGRIAEAEPMARIAAWLRDAADYLADAARARKASAEVRCNGCGASCMSEVAPGRPWPHGLVDAQIVGGYGSTELRDGVRHGFSLCEQCLVKMFDRFAHPPTVTHVSDGKSTTWAQDRRDRAEQVRMEAAMAAWTCPDCGTECAVWSSAGAVQTASCENGHKHTAWVWGSGS
jgi:ribosomal protein S27E